LAKPNADVITVAGLTPGGRHPILRNGYKADFLVFGTAYRTRSRGHRATGPEDWRNGMADAKAQLDNFAAAAGPGAVIIGGDCNSTPDMRQFRDLLTNGHHDAVEQTGSGFAPTYPSDIWFPPVITIDHVLTRNAVASSITTIDVTGSDHRSLLANISVAVIPVWAG